MICSDILVEILRVNQNYSTSDVTRGFQNAAPLSQSGHRNFLEISGF